MQNKARHSITMYNIEGLLSMTNHFKYSYATSIANWLSLFAEIIVTNSCKQHRQLSTYTVQKVTTVFKISSKLRRFKNSSQQKPAAKLASLCKNHNSFTWITIKQLWHMLINTKNTAWNVKFPGVWSLKLVLEVFRNNQGTVWICDCPYVQAPVTKK